MPRLSRNEALRTLDQIIAAALEFTGDESAAITHAARTERDYLDESTTHLPDAQGIRDLRTRVAALQAARLFRSAALQPVATPAATVFTFGTTDNEGRDLAHAAHTAAASLQVQDSDLLLVDVTPVRTAEHVGTRYTFRVRSPFDAPQAAAAL